MALAFGGGNGGLDASPQLFTVEHDPDLRPADVALVVIEATPTASPVAIAPTVAAVQQSTVTVPLPAGLENCPAVIVETFGEQAPAACAVVKCESNFRADAIGDSGNALGYFQVWPLWHQAKADALFGAGANLLDPEVNVAVSYVISNGGTNWAQWTCQP